MKLWSAQTLYICYSHYQLTYFHVTCHIKSLVHADCFNNLIPVLLIEGFERNGKKS